MIEKMSGGNEADSQSFIWTKSIIGSIKGMLMVSVFVINGHANDFFLGCFFWITCSIGMVFFFNCPYINPVE